MGQESVYLCSICGDLNVLYEMDDKPRPLGHILYYYCKNECVYEDDINCKIKGKSKLIKVYDKNQGALK